MSDNDTITQQDSSADSTEESPVVLVVDDEPLVLRVCRRILERAGHRVIAVEDPQKAEQVMRDQERRVGVLVCDIQMPGLTGGALAAQLCDQQPSLKVIFISGHASAKEVCEACEDSAVGFLSKPFGPDELLGLIDEALAC